MKITIEHLTKQFNIGYFKKMGALARAIRFISGRVPERLLCTVDNISYTIPTGTIVGLVGNNGSGKSTLLRCIGHIYRPSSGTVRTNGRVISLLDTELTNGDRLTAKDNIFFGAALFGLPKSEITKKFDSIVEFAELQDFINTKLYQFSSGMKERLMFSIAVHCMPDILLLDEILDTVDQEFKAKALDRLQQLKQSGTVIVLASHALELIERICDQVLLLENGRVITHGPTKTVVEAYRNHINKPFKLHHVT